MIITIGIIVLLLLVIAGLYNGLIGARNRVDEAWSDINVQLKRRHDLIPNLVETVKGYATHEKTAFENVTAARSAAMGASNPQQLGQAENQLSRALGGIFAIAEAYPELKANQNFMQLQGDLTDTEDKIQASRRFYNGNVRDYNTKLQVFPTNIFARMFGFVKREFFDLDDASEKAAPQVKF